MEIRGNYFNADDPPDPVLQVRRQGRVPLVRSLAGQGGFARGLEVGRETVDVSGVQGMIARFYNKYGLVCRFEIDKPKRSIRFPVAGERFCMDQYNFDQYETPQFGYREFGLKAVIDGEAIYMEIDYDMKGKK